MIIMKGQFQMHIMIILLKMKKLKIFNVEQTNSKKNFQKQIFLQNLTKTLKFEIFMKNQKKNQFTNGIM